MSERLYCCVDGGASNTRVALYDGAGHRLGLTVTGPTSLTVRGTEAWADILDALENLSRAVALEGDYLPRVHFGVGLAGANNNAQRQRFVDAAPSAGALRVSTDAYIAALGAHGGSPGAVIIIGTGSVGYRIEAAGRCRLVGGWGFPIGDEGSGAWIGRRAVAQVAQIVDTRFRRRITEMHRAVMAVTGNSRDALLDWLLAAPLLTVRTEISNQSILLSYSEEVVIRNLWYGAQSPWVGQGSTLCGVQRALPGGSG